MTDSTPLFEKLFGGLPVLKRGQCPMCGSMDALKAMEKKSLPLKVGHLSKVVDGLSGEECQQCGEFFLDEESGRRFSEAGDQLVLQYRKEKGGE